MKKRVAFVVAGDKQNMEFAEKMKNSLRKFHSEKQLPLILIGPAQISAQKDPSFFYRATPIVASDLLKEYETVIKLDADQVITGDISHVWDMEGADIAVVQNSNPRETKSYPVSVWDIDAPSYVNAGFVVMRSKKLVDHWRALCFSPHFNNYQMKEQDLLNIMVFYGDYKIKFLDNSIKWHGLISKQYEPYMVLEGKGKKKQIILPKNDEWPNNEDKQIVCVHWAGGNNPLKGNHNIKFNSKVSKHIDWLISKNEG